MNLFEELRHRNVFKVAAAYTVVGWLLAQVADLVVDAFNLPDRFLQMIIITLVLGFPIAVFFAWVFELTPDGLKKAKDLPADMPKDPRSGKILNRLTMGLLIVAVIWLGWDKFQAPEPEPVANEEHEVTDKSIAVLPFADFSPDGQQGWFADGLTDEILNALARTSDLRVASRTSSFQYRNSQGDLPRIATELGVAHILEGSVRRAGDKPTIRTSGRTPSTAPPRTRSRSRKTSP
jgi:adenylate cyclase